MPRASGPAAGRAPEKYVIVSSTVIAERMSVRPALPRDGRL